MRPTPLSTFWSFFPLPWWLFGPIFSWLSYDQSVEFTQKVIGKGIILLCFLLPASKFQAFRKPVSVAWQPYSQKSQEPLHWSFLRSLRAAWVECPNAAGEHRATGGTTFYSVLCCEVKKYFGRLVLVWIVSFILRKHANSRWYAVIFIQQRKCFQAVIYPGILC